MKSLLASSVAFCTLFGILFWTAGNARSQNGAQPSASEGATAPALGQAPTLGQLPPPNAPTPVPVVGVKPVPPSARLHSVMLSANGSVTVRLSMIDPASGMLSPVRDVNVSLIQNGRILASVQPGPDGRFTLSGLQPGVYSIVAQGPGGFGAFSIHLSPYDAANPGPVELVLEGTLIPPQDAAVVYGLISANNVAASATPGTAATAGGAGGGGGSFGGGGGGGGGGGDTGLSSLLGLAGLGGLAAAASDDGDSNQPLASPFVP